MTLKIQRSTEGPGVVFTLSGRIEGEHVAELQSLFESEAEDHRLVLDLTEVKLVDRETVQFLAVVRRMASRLGIARLISASGLREK